ncbi:MAG: DUF4956 domain-containing protein [Bacteroidota bacterium]
MGVFDAYLEEFSQSVNLTDFIVNMLVAALLLVLLRMFYIRFGQAVTNRARFAHNFLLLGLTTMLMITIVKSSIALSLGLVGALSIVRFRAAIKDPEELTYLFLSIAIGLAAGANQPLIAAFAFVCILMLLFAHNRFSRGESVKRKDRMYINISTDVEDMERVAGILGQHLAHVELKRVDQTPSGMQLSFIIKSDSLQHLVATQQALKALSEATSFSVVDQPDLII